MHRETDKYYEFEPLNDPEFDPTRWYYDKMNITGAWHLGYTGKGVTISILDDGLEITHPDLIHNYSEEASYDFNDNDRNPTPRYTQDNQNKHGTRCGRIVSASANNSVCIPGIAFNSKIGGVRMLDGVVNDNVEAQSINWGRDIIDIYSSSWVSYNCKNFFEYFFIVAIFRDQKMTVKP